MITGRQIRAARHGLRWTLPELATAAHLSVSSIKRVEAEDGVPAVSAKNLARIQAALEAAGIQFIGTPDDAPGIRIHRHAD
jgi:transcriptional regulator with XRE-family HTH domain